MKILDCPLIGPRPIQEFQSGGELRDMPDPKLATDEQWADYVFNRSGEPSTKREWWFHVASSTWFIAERDTRTNEVHWTAHVADVFGEGAGAGAADTADTAGAAATGGDGGGAGGGHGA